MTTMEELMQAALIAPDAAKRPGFVFALRAVLPPSRGSFRRRSESYGGQDGVTRRRGDLSAQIGGER